MNDDVLQAHQIDPTPEFVPDPSLDSLYREAVAAARKFGCDVPVRAEFERKYNAEIAASRKNQ